MQFTREISRLMVLVVLLYGLTALGAAYWAVVGPDTILEREDNPRRVEAEAALVRGSIHDRNGVLLVESIPTNGATERRYLYPAMHGTLGYASLRYGGAGVEAAFNATLRGDDLPVTLGETLADDLLNRAQVGSDVRLTLDLALQRQLADALAGQRGAGVVLSVPDGAVLALVSVPTYDPNQLDANWESLSTDPGNPFFNRAVQGQYQPGGLLETPLMAAALLYEVPLNEPLARATQPISMEDVTLECAVRLPDMPLTLREAYGFACPAPFVTLATDVLRTGRVQDTFVTFGLYDTPTLPGYPAAPALSLTPLDFRDERLRRNAVGQGRLTVSPLLIATMTAGIVNDGNRPQPFLLQATRPPGAVEWQPDDAVRPTLPISTTNTARQLQDLMRAAVANGAAHNAGRPDLDIGGHATLAHSGDETQAWFTGFVTLGPERGVAVAIVLEDSADPGLAAAIGGETLEVAHRLLAVDAP